MNTNLLSSRDNLQWSRDASKLGLGGAMDSGIAVFLAQNI